MSEYSAAYNFPPGFLWGVSAEGKFQYFRDNPSLLYTLAEKSVGAISFHLNWGDYEPLPNNYDESLIESTRSLFSRVHSRNIEPVLIIDISEIPHWQNLEKGQNREFFTTSKFNFVTHLAGTLLPYTKYIGLVCPQDAFYSPKILESELNLHEEIKTVLTSLSDQCKTGTVIPKALFHNQERKLRIFSRQLQFQPLKNISMDFIGISTAPAVRVHLDNLFKEEKIPLFILTDELRKTPQQQKIEVLADAVYDVWNYYQKGWPLIGYISEAELEKPGAENDLYTNCCIQNAFEISTENQNLPDKWMRFLKD